jgi:serine/threonine protein kinase
MERLGKYVLLERLNAGGMAEVWRAKLLGAAGVHKDVAVKRILPEHAKSSAFVQMFLDEARLTVQLTHSNIVPVYELAEQSGSYILTMEFLAGKNLGEILDACVLASRFLPPLLCAYLAREVCRGLDYAHRRVDAQGRPLGIVHRDISPQNVMVSYDGEVKILDFGIAKARSHLNVTQAGVIKGKHGYLAPEQARGDPIDYRVDVFASGILLYEMLTLQRLFAGETDIETLEAVKRCDVPSPSKYNPAAPPVLEAVCFRALARDPAERFPSAGAMADALTRAGADAAGGGRALQALLAELFTEDRNAEVKKRKEFDEAVRGMSLTESDKPIAKQRTPAPLPAIPRPQVVIIEPEPEEREHRRSKVPLFLVVAAIAAGLFFGRNQVAEAFDKLVHGPKAKKLGTLTVRSTPTGADVMLDGMRVGTTAATLAGLDPDQVHHLLIVHGCCPPKKRDITPRDWNRAIDPMVLAIDEPLQSAPPPRR